MVSLREKGHRQPAAFLRRRPGKRTGAVRSFWGHMQPFRRLRVLISTLPLVLLIRGDNDFLLSAEHRLALAQGLPASEPTRPEPIPSLTQSSISSDGLKPLSGLCPMGMVFIDGDYCSQVRHFCAEWLDDPKLPYARCGRYERRAQCLTPTEHLRFCIDREEFTRPGSSIPENFLSFALGVKLCRTSNKRLCKEREWNFACEGEEMRPYPYGWSREPKCNQDHDDLLETHIEKGKQRQRLRDLRAPSGEFPECVSPFGVLNLVGNLDEPVLRDGISDGPMRMALKGGWWMPGRNRCRPATTAHDIYYRDVQVGARCCADVVDRR